MFEKVPKCGLIVLTEYNILSVGVGIYCYVNTLKLLINGQQCVQL